MDNDKKLLEISCKEMLMEIIRDSENLNKKLTFYEKTSLYDVVEKLSFQEVASLLFSETSREIEAKDDRDTKYGAAMTAGGAVPFIKRRLSKNKNLIPMKKVAISGALAVGALFLYRKLTDPCFKQTIRILNPSKRKIAELNCKMEAIKRVIAKIQADIQKCQHAENPESCANKLVGELSKWRKKYEEHLHKITTLRDDN